MPRAEPRAASTVRDIARVRRRAVLVMGLSSTWWDGAMLRHVRWRGRAAPRSAGEQSRTGGRSGTGDGQNLDSAPVSGNRLPSFANVNRNPQGYGPVLRDNGAMAAEYERTDALRGARFTEADLTGAT